MKIRENIIMMVLVILIMFIGVIMAIYEELLGYFMSS